jgi:pimeloyl-ACP methyl ester carboxylesterase
MYDVRRALRKHGRVPRRVVVLHGGPGAPGSAGQLARDISSRFGVLEPWQRADSLEALVAELACVLRYDAALPAVLVGHSWGALLGFMTAARHPELVSRLVMIGAPPFEARYAAGIMPVRLERLDARQREEVLRMQAAFGDSRYMSRHGDELLQQFGHVLSTADAWNPAEGAVVSRQPCVPCSFAQYEALSAQAEPLRRSGALLALAESVRCPVVALHGEYDPHPVEGVRRPLAGALGDFRCIVLPHCGHTPWREREARAVFYDTLFRELT